jgi:hypothetical protein
MDAPTNEQIVRLLREVPASLAEIAPRPDAAAGAQLPAPEAGSRGGLGGRAGDAP